MTLWQGPRRSVGWWKFSSLPTSSSSWQTLEPELDVQRHSHMEDRASGRCQVRVVAGRTQGSVPPLPALLSSAERQPPLREPRPHCRPAEGLGEGGDGRAGSWARPGAVTSLEGPWRLDAWGSLPGTEVSREKPGAARGRPDHGERGAGGLGSWKQPCCLSSGALMPVLGSGLHDWSRFLVRKARLGGQGPCCQEQVALTEARRAEPSR